MIENTLGQPDMTPEVRAVLRTVPRHLDGTLKDDVMELLSPPRVVPAVVRLGGRGNISADILTGFNLTDPSVQKNILYEIACRRPRVVVLSPPCTLFSALMRTNWSRMSPQLRRER